MKPKKALQNRMFIFCEGEKSEPDYLLNYINEHAPNKSKVITIPKTKKNTPIQLVDEAIKMKNSDSSLIGDSFWIVYDRESENQVSRTKHLTAWNKAIKNNINIAISNVCFEYWILLHFEQTNQPYTSFQNLMSESRLKHYLKRVNIINYEKGNDELYFKINKGIKNARLRAKHMNKQSQNINQRHDCMPFDCSPYTGITYLLDAIDNF